MGKNDSFQEEKESVEMTFFRKARVVRLARKRLCVYFITIMIVYHFGMCCFPTEMFGEEAGEKDPCLSCQRWNVIRTDPQNAFSQVQFFNRQLGFGQNGECLWMTTDGGQSWKHRYCVSSYKKSSHYRILDVQFISFHEGWMLVEEEQQQQLLHSQDRGATWNSQRFDKNICFLKVRFYDRLTGWLVGLQLTSSLVEDIRGIIYGTTNGGKTWREFQTGISADFRWYFNGVYPVSRTNIWVVGDSFLLHSVNGGNVWQEIAMPDEFFSLHNISSQFADPMIGWILRSPAENYLFTQDGGQTWNTRLSPTRWNVIYDLIYLNSKEAWATFDNIYYSSDNGKTWQMDFTSPYERTPYYTIQYLQSEQLLLATGHGIIATRTIP